MLSEYKPKITLQPGPKSTRIDISAKSFVNKLYRVQNILAF